MNDPTMMQSPWLGIPQQQPMPGQMVAQNNPLDTPEMRAKAASMQQAFGTPPSPMPTPSVQPPAAYPGFGESVSHGLLHLQQQRRKK